MGALTNYVTITIQRNSVGITRAGFGTLLVLTPNFVGGPARTRSYADLAAVAVDYPITTSMEYKAAEAAFTGDIAPTRIKYGSLLLKPTLKYRIDIVAIRNTYTYEIDVAGKGITAERADFTSDGSATDTEISVGITAALNAVVGKNYTAVAVVDAGNDYVEVTGTAEGDWFSLSIVNTEDLKMTLTHADPGVATDLAAIKIYDGDFYMVWNGFNSSAMATPIATWVEANKRTFMFNTYDTEVITLAPGGGDVAQALKTAGRDNTVVFYHHIPFECAGARWAGECLPDEPGTETWADKQLEGVTPSPFTQTHRDNLTGKNANGYEQVTADIACTFDGKTPGGEFFDTTRFLHWFEDDASKEIFGIKVANRKIPMSNPGIAKIESGLRRSLARGSSPERPGFFPDWAVVVPDAADISDPDRASRTLNGVKASAKLQGAVHKVNVQINVIG